MHDELDLPPGEMKFKKGGVSRSRLNASEKNRNTSERDFGTICSRSSLNVLLNMVVFKTSSFGYS